MNKVFGEIDDDRCQPVSRVCVVRRKPYSSKKGFASRPLPATLYSCSERLGLFCARRDQQCRQVFLNRLRFQLLFSGSQQFLRCVIRQQNFPLRIRSENRQQGYFLLTRGAVLLPPAAVVFAPQPLPGAA